MLKRNWKVISRIHRVLDNAIVIAAFFLSYALRDEFLSFFNTSALPFPQEVKGLAPMENYLIVLGVALPMYNAALSMLGAYRSMRLSNVWQLARLALVASSVVFLCQGSVLYVLKLDLSRSFVVVFCVLSGVGLLIERTLALFVLRYVRFRGKNFRRVLISGIGPQARRLYLEVIKQPELGIRVVGFVDLSAGGQRYSAKQRAALRPEHSASGSAIENLPAGIVANSHNFEAALKKLAIDEVLFTDVFESMQPVRDAAHIAAEEGVRVTFAADLFGLELLRSDISYFGSIPLVHYESSPSDRPGLVAKRVLDIIVSSLGLIFLSPLLLSTALVIRATSPGPVFFRQRRVGLNGRIFVLLKFRSMIEGAEKKLDELKSQNEMSGPAFKMKDDPRVTPVGRFLRKWSIDELPQLFNVLRGDMSLVGPRPPIPAEVELYRRSQRRRLSMRPGITCTWQVSGRNEIPDFETWAKLDLEYIDNWSLWRDLHLLVRTVPAVLSGDGAR